MNSIFNCFRLKKRILFAECVIAKKDMMNIMERITAKICKRLNMH